MTETKMWGSEPFWGIGYDYDPMWVLDEQARELQPKIIELARTTLRVNAVVSDATYEYPRKNLNALASFGLLGLIVPKELGGLGASHTTAAMVVETIARYGCASTAMCYVMHTGAVAAALLRYHDSALLTDLLKRLDKECLVGTLSYSDPATGSHFWFPMSSKCKKTEDGSYMTRKVSSWCTSSGYSDWTIFQTTSPSFGGDYGNLSVFLAFKDEVRSNPQEWRALGLRGNQSAPLVIEEKLAPERLIGPVGDGGASNDEAVDPFFLLLSSACWIGLSLAMIDLCKKHTTQKRHADVGLRVCDYPTIQDYVGECLCDANASRSMLFQVASALDKATNDCDWSIHKDLTLLPRAAYLPWLWQLKFSAAKTAHIVSDKMLHACGGTAYKYDLGMERLLRDAKAGWVMGPSNEVLRQFVGKTALLGMDVLDYWSQKANHRAIHTEVKKLGREEKLALAQRLMKEVELDTAAETNPSDDTRDFVTPFAFAPPQTVPGGALNANEFSKVTLASIIQHTAGWSEYKFTLPDGKPAGLIDGQFITMRMNIADEGEPPKLAERYFSPVSRADQAGSFDIVVKFEFQGKFATCFQRMKPGDTVEMKGPAGGLQYNPNKLDHLGLIAGGGGITPCLQLIRAIANNKEDKTKVWLIWGNEEEEDFFCRDELDKYAKENDNITVFYTVKNNSPSWDQGIGYADGPMLDEHMCKPDSAAKQKIVLCGGPSMVITMCQFMFERDFKSEDIFVYGHTGDEQLRSVFGRNAPLGSHIV